MLERTAPIAPRIPDRPRDEERTESFPAVERPLPDTPDAIFNEVLGTLSIPHRIYAAKYRETILQRVAENYDALRTSGIDLNTNEASPREYYLDAIRGYVADLPFWKLTGGQSFDEIPHRIPPEVTPPMLHDADTDVGNFDDSSARETRSD